MEENSFRFYFETNRYHIRILWYCHHCKRQNILTIIYNRLIYNKINNYNKLIIITIISCFIK